MIEAWIALLVIGGLILGILAAPVLRQRRRDRLKRKPFPPLWQAVVEQQLPIYPDLSPQERHRLQGHMQVFLAEKQFIGCGGLQITDEIRLAIAAVACLLLFNERNTYFPRLQSILVYPGAYWVDELSTENGVWVEERRVARLGESWATGQLVLSWPQVQQDTRQWRNGHVVLHEFAHQLDQEDGRAEGVPVLAHPAEYARWAQVMGGAYTHLCQQVERGWSTPINAYGTTNPAEFFAVTTETFFTAPWRLYSQYPAVYALLQDYYHLTPRQWGD